MSTSWNRFNSDFLNILHRSYGGVFREKILTGIKAFQNQKDLDTMIFEMFPPEEMDVTVPSNKHLEMFEKGDVGNDFVVLMYLDKMVSSILQASFASDHERAIQQAEEVLGLFDTINLYHYPPTLDRYLSLFQFISRRGAYETVSITIQNIEDLSLFGVLALLEATFKQKELSSPRLAYHGTPRNMSHLNYLAIPKETFAEIQRASSEIDPPINIENFAFLNSGGVVINARNQQIQELIPDVLKSSSFLWKNELLNVSPEAVESMDENQRLLTLIRNKSAILNNCFSSLKEIAIDKKHLETPQFLDSKNKIEAVGNVLVELLNQRSEKEGLLSQKTQIVQSIKQDLVEVLTENNIPEQRASLEILKFLEKRILPEDVVDLEKQAILKKYFLRYQQAFLDKQALVEKLKDLKEEIQLQKTILEDLFRSFLTNFSSFLPPTQ